MNIRYMKYYIHTADRGSISSAAADLFISPQGLSKALHKVEENYDLTLFYVDGNRFVLTEAGESVYNTFLKITSLDDELISNLNKVKERDHRQPPCLLIFSAPIFIDTVIPKILPLFYKNTPNVKVRLIEYPSPDRLCNTTDLSNTVYLFGASPSKLEAMCRKFPELPEKHILMETNILGCFSKRSNLKANRYLSRKDFSRRNMVLCRHEDYFLKKINPEYDPAQISIRSDNKEACFLILEDNPDSIGFTNQIELSYYSGTCSLQTLPIQPNLQMLYGYLINESSKSSQELQAFLNVLEREFQKLSGKNRV